MSRVLVLDAQMRHSLAIVRSLGRHGLDVTTAEDTRFALAAHSRYSRRHLVYPSPARDPDGFVAWLEKVVAQGRYDVIFPVTDATCLLVAKHRTRLEPFVRVPLVDYDCMLQARDKACTIDFAERNGIAVPKTLAPRSLDELEAVATSLPYPLIVKARESSGSRGLHLVNDPTTLLRAYRENLATYGHSLVQDYVPPGGDEVGVYALVGPDGELRAHTVQRRIRSYPHTGGPSTLRETIAWPELAADAARFLKAMGWAGVAMVEYRVDPRTGTPKLMEVNPRFWGSLALSIHAGVDFPWLLYRMAMDGDIPEQPTYRVHAKCRWLFPGDVLHLLTAPGKLHNLREFVRFRGNDLAYDVESREDPWPAFASLLIAARFVFNRDARRLAIRPPLEPVVVKP